MIASRAWKWLNALVLFGGLTLGSLWLDGTRCALKTSR